MENSRYLLPPLIQKQADSERFRHRHIRPFQTPPLCTPPLRDRRPKDGRFSCRPFEAVAPRRFEPRRRRNSQIQPGIKADSQQPKNELNLPEPKACGAYASSWSAAVPCRFRTHERRSIGSQPYPQATKTIQAAPSPRHFKPTPLSQPRPSVHSATLANHPLPRPARGSSRKSHASPCGFTHWQPNNLRSFGTIEVRTSIEALFQSSPR
jgi:hypothetical protein